MKTSMAITEGIVAATIVLVFDLLPVEASSDVLPDGEVEVVPADVLPIDEADCENDCDEDGCDEADCIEDDSDKANCVEDGCDGTGCGEGGCGEDGCGEDGCDEDDCNEGAD